MTPAPSFGGVILPWGWVLGYYAGTALITLVLYAWDKHAAQRGAERVRERTLHLAAWAGGFIGALLGQNLLRHKSQQTRFAVVTWLALLVHLAGWFVWLRR